MSALANWLGVEPTAAARREAMLRRQLAETNEALIASYAARDLQEIRHRQALEDARAEAFPPSGPPGCDGGAAREVALLKRALRETQDRLAAAEGRPVHGDRYARWSPR